MIVPPAGGELDTPTTSRPQSFTLQILQSLHQPPQQQHNPSAPTTANQATCPACLHVPLLAENHVVIMSPYHVQAIQTHVFALIVTGAPQRKYDFSSGGSIGNLATTGTGMFVFSLLAHLIVISLFVRIDAPPPTPQHIYPRNTSLLGEIQDMLPGSALVRLRPMSSANSTLTCACLAAGYAPSALHTSFCPSMSATTCGDGVIFVHFLNHSTGGSSP